MEARIAELIAVGIILLCVFQGAVKGLVLTVYSMVRLIFLLILTMIIAPLIVPLFPTDYVAREGIAFLVGLVISGIVLGIIAQLLHIIDHIPVLNAINKIGGAAVGLLWGLILVWVALLIIGTFQEVQWCQKASEYVRQSQILMEVQKFNPLPAILKNFDFPIL